MNESETAPSPLNTSTHTAVSVWQRKSWIYAQLSNSVYGLLALAAIENTDVVNGATVYVRICGVAALQFPTIQETMTTDLVNWCSSSLLLYNFSSSF